MHCHNQRETGKARREISYDLKGPGSVAPRQMTTVNRKQPEVASIGAKVGFFEPMLCLAVEKLPEGPAWQYEVELDGYRAIGVRTRSGVELSSRNKRDFSRRFPNIAHALGAVPVDTVLDGDIVAVNGDGLPSFSSLQNFDGAAAILFYVFDAPVLAGADLRSKPLATRRKMLRELIPSLPDTIRFSETFDAFPNGTDGRSALQWTRRCRGQAPRQLIQTWRSFRRLG